MGAGGPQKADKRNKISLFVTVRVKKSENFADVIYRSPLRAIILIINKINHLLIHCLVPDRATVDGVHGLVGVY